MRGICKSFGQTRALDGVDLEVLPGEVHALLGENGAGKTTLMNVLVGLLRPDAGSLVLGAKPVDWASFTPADAVRAGVGMVHQHSALVPALTVVENLFFGDPLARSVFRPQRARRTARALAERFELAVPLDRRVGDLSVGERQRAEILRALDRGVRLLILDEPTAVLTPGESQALFAALQRLSDAGRAVIFISHKLDEVEALADRVTVLRRGRLAACVAAEEADARRLGCLMLGRELPGLARIERTRERASGGQPSLAIHSLSAPGLSEASRLRAIDLEVRAGEIVGLVGIDGNGQRELEEVLAGVRRATRGEIRVCGRRVEPRPRALRAAGLENLV